MNKQIQFKNITFQVKKRNIFEHFNFNLQEGKSVCLIGSPAVGKTSLLKMVKEELNYFGDILKEAPCRVLLSNQLSSDELIYEYLNYKSLQDSDKRLVQKFLKLKSLSYPIKKLSLSYQLKVSLLKQILEHPTFLFVDDILSVFSKREKKEFFELIKQEQITLFYVTSNMEDVLFFPYLVIMGKSGVLLEGITLSVLQEEKILKRLGFSLPFFVDLSLQLKSYELINQMIINPKELTETLWK